MSIGFWLLAEFLALVILGALLFGLIRWEQALTANRDLWLQQLRGSATRLRRLRQGLEKNGGELPSLPLGAKTRQKLNVVRWIVKLLFAARPVRS